MHNLNNIFNFFRQLKYNNNVDWMHANKQLYEQARTDFFALGDEIIQRLSVADESISHQTTKQSAFRLARDTRFSANKLPYHTHFGLLLTPQGKMSAMAGYFIYLQPDDEDGDYFTTSMIGAGIYAPPAKLAKVIRQAIFDDGDVMQNYLQSDTYINSGLQLYTDETLRSLPKQWADSPHQDLIRNKHWMLCKQLTEEESQHGNFADIAINTLSAAKEWNNFINQALIDSGESLSWKR